MELESADGPQALSLAFSGYRYGPDPGNFLTVSGRVRHPHGEWEFRDPCITCTEALSLASSLELLANSQPRQTEITFIEPNLRFDVSGSDGPWILRVFFELESRPVWARTPDTEEYEWVQFRLSELDLTVCAASLRREIAALPPYRQRRR